MTQKKKKCLTQNKRYKRVLKLNWIEMCQPFVRIFPILFTSAMSSSFTWRTELTLFSVCKFKSILKEGSISKSPETWLPHAFYQQHVFCRICFLLLVFSGGDLCLFSITATWKVGVFCERLMWFSNKIFLRSLVWIKRECYIEDTCTHTHTLLTHRKMYQ